MQTEGPTEGPTEEPSKEPTASKNANTLAAVRCNYAGPARRESSRGTSHPITKRRIGR